MSRTNEETVTLTCALDDVEQDVAATMMQMTGITSEANLVRLGLWHLAKHLHVPVGQAFAMRAPKAKRANRLTERMVS